MPTSSTSDELRVLVVDDEPDAATTLSYLLQMLGCRTAVAYGAETGLRALREFDPALAFVDLAMPGLHGLDMMQIAKAVPSGGRNTMFVCLTALNGYEKQAREAGFERYVIKPIETSVLNGILAEARARRAASADDPGADGAR